MVTLVVGLNNNRGECSKRETPDEYTRTDHQTQGRPVAPGDRARERLRACKVMGYSHGYQQAVDPSLVKRPYGKDSYLVDAMNVVNDEEYRLFRSGFTNSRAGSEVAELMDNVPAWSAIAATVSRPRSSPPARHGPRPAY